jgi:imidazole glycerol-phosphate synthase subunit HisH
MKTDPVIIGCCGANLSSLTFAFARLGIDVPITEDPQRVRRASHVVLPGVGAAKDAMGRLDRAGFVELVPELRQPVLGICLGMQLLFTASDEEDARCLGILPARVARLPEKTDLPIPEMGWNQIEVSTPSPLLEGVANGAYAYFVHSYAAPVGPYTRATSDYGGPFSAVVEQDNFFGTQFHPERSSALGARILANFLALKP